MPLDDAMQTQCPSCRSIFRVTYQQLSAAGGLVRCGKCSVIFNGNDNIRHLRSDAASSLSPTPNRTPGIAAAAAVGGDPPKPVIARKQKAQVETAPDYNPPMSTAAEPEEPAHPQVEYYLSPPGHPRRSRRIIRYGSITLLILILLLTAQYVYNEREHLTDYPTLSGWMTKTCEYIGCEVTPRRDVDHIEIIGRNVYSHPDRPDTLRISATLVNKAPFPQSYPLTQVSFTNLQGTVVAARRFKPSEYLSSMPKTGAMMPSGTPVKARMEVPDPGMDATAFEFAFINREYRSPGAFSAAKKILKGLGIIQCGCHHKNSGSPLRLKTLIITRRAATGNAKRADAIRL
jgi:predicted Zn finger-like uncharacterized protein